MATLYRDTVENVLQDVSDLRGESSTNTDNIRIRALSRQERALAKRKLWKLFNLPNQTDTGDGTNDYEIGSATYPMRQQGLSEVFVGGTTADKAYQIVDFHKFKELYNQNNSNQIVYLWFDAANDAWKMHINPAPETGVTITYSYFWIPPKRTADTDYVYSVDMEALTRLTLSELYELEDEAEKAVEQRQIAEEIISEAMGYDNSPNYNQLFKFDAIENASQTRGIGGY